MSTTLATEGVGYGGDFSAATKYSHTPASLTAKAWNWNGSANNGSLVFTGLPSWAKKIYVLFDRLSISSADTLAIQLGESGVSSTTGYAGTNDSWTSTPGPVAWGGASAGLAQLSANQQVSGIVTISCVYPYNRFAIAFVGGCTNAAVLHLAGGIEPLAVVPASTLTQIRVHTYTSGPVFNNGTVNVLYE